MAPQLSCAAYKGHSEVLRYLVEKGSEKDKADDEGWTAYKGHLDELRYLVEQGADKE